MAMKINEECIACGACVPECPTNSITEGDIYVIDAATCVECDGYFTVPRCKSVCPVGACNPARETYLVKMQSLANRGAPPFVLRRAQEPA